LRNLSGISTTSFKKFYLTSNTTIHTIKPTEMFDLTSTIIPKSNMTTPRHSTSSERSYNLPSSRQSMTAEYWSNPVLNFGLATPAPVTVSSAASPSSRKTSAALSTKPRRSMAEDYWSDPMMNAAVGHFDEAKTASVTVAQKKTEKKVHKKRSVVGDYWSNPSLNFGLKTV
jgi:hypothetical protein